MVPIIHTAQEKHNESIPNMRFKHIGWLRLISPGMREPLTKLRQLTAKHKDGLRTVILHCSARTSWNSFVKAAKIMS